MLGEIDVEGVDFLHSCSVRDERRAVEAHAVASEDSARPHLTA